MSVIDKLTSSEYLFSTNEQLKYWYLYLPVFGIFVLLAFVVSVFIKKQKDYKAKKGFQKQFLWTYMTFGLLGLTSLFARSQNLPVFGSRVFTFTIIALFLITNVWLFIYFLKVTRKEQLKFAQKARKEKWLKKK